MNALELLGKNIDKYKAQGRQVRAVVLDPDAVARGFVFFVQYRDHVFALANEKDVAQAQAGLYMQGDTSDYLNGISILRGGAYVLEVSSGVYLCAYSVQ